MLISRWLVPLALTFVVLGSSCSSKDKKQASKVVQDLESKTKEVATDVANKGKEVVSATGEAITDGWITTKLKAKFADDKQLKASNITVETSDRVVTLKGTVGTEEARKRAVMIATGTEGVLRVVSQVVLEAK